MSYSPEEKKLVAWGGDEVQRAVRGWGTDRSIGWHPQNEEQTPASLWRSRAVFLLARGEQKKRTYMDRHHLG